MIEFYPCTDTEKLKSLCAEQQIAYSKNIFGYTAVENSEDVAYALFEIDGAVVNMLCVPDDDYMADVLTRSGMSFALTRGYKQVCFAKVREADRLKKLGFIPNAVGDLYEIEGFFHGCAGCAEHK